MASPRSLKNQPTKAAVVARRNVPESLFVVHHPVGLMLNTN
jgi:hypothetical protein